MNGMIGRVRDDLSRLRSFSDEVAEHGEALAAAGELSPEAQRSLIELTTATTRLRQLVGAWKLEPAGDPVATKTAVGSTPSTTRSSPRARPRLKGR